MGLEVTPKMSNRLIRLKKSAVKSTGQSADKYVRPIRDPFPGHLTASHRMLFFVKINRNEMTNELQVTKWEVGAPAKQKAPKRRNTKKKMNDGRFVSVICLWVVFSFNDSWRDVILISSTRIRRFLDFCCVCYCGWKGGPQRVMYRSIEPLLNNLVGSHKIYLADGDARWKCKWPSTAVGAKSISVFCALTVNVKQMTIHFLWNNCKRSNV